MQRHMQMTYAEKQNMQMRHAYDSLIRVQGEYNI